MADARWMDGWMDRYVDKFTDGGHLFICPLLNLCMAEMHIVSCALGFSVQWTVTYVNESRVFLIYLHYLLVCLVPHSGFWVCSHCNEVWDTLHVKREKQ